MNISFDLDDTLICDDSVPKESQSFLARLGGMESLRKGAIPLFFELQRQGHTTSIYTSSLRPHWRIRLLFLSYGVSLWKIVTAQTKRSKNAKHSSSSKFPPDFGFDLHIDDSEGVAVEGARHNFDTIIISPSDTNWTRKVLREVESRALQQPMTKRLNRV